VDGFLFYREDVDFSVGPGILSEQYCRAVRAAQEPGEDVFQAALESFVSGKAEQQQRSRAGGLTDSVAALVDFHEQLQARDIHLVVVPMPVKPVIYPEKLWPAYPLTAGPAWNPDYPLWKKRLTDAGVDVLDLSEHLWKAKTTTGAPLFRKIDTHWSPEGMAVSADRIAAHVKALLGTYESVSYTTRREMAGGSGDLMVLLDLHPDWSPFTPEEFELIAVQQGGQPASASEEAKVLLLGDSFVAQYTEGIAAGLAAHLMQRLGTGVQTTGSSQGYSVLDNQQILAAQPHLLRNKKVVVLEFVSRHLTSKSIRWEKVTIPHLPVVEPVPEPIDPRFVEGYLDAVDGGTIVGWAWVSTHPNNAVEINIYDGNLLLATVRADEFRTDLRDARKGNGFHGFHYDLPAQLKDAKDHTFRAIVAGTEVELRKP